MKTQTNHILANICLLALLLFSPASSALADTHRVLILNSFNEGYHWTDRIMQGIKSVLNDEENVDLFIDYMDAKRCSDPDYLEKFKDLLAHKYRFHKFDAILSTDDPALDFLLTYRDTLFPGVPVVFCGINDYHPERIASHSNITGIYETSDITGTVEMMLQLHPETTEVAIVLDTTISGQYFLDRIQRLEGTFKNRVIFRYLTGLNLDQLKDALQDLPETTLPLWAIYLRTPQGVSLSSKESVRFTCDHSPRPVYCIWDVVGQGVVGGRVTSPNFQGEMAAGRTLALLQGAKIETMSVSGSPPVSIFDYVVMKQHGIDANQLPDEAIILNRPFSFYREFKHLIWMTGAFGLILLATIFALIQHIRKRRLAEGALKESDERYRIMSERTGQMVYDFDLNKGTIKWAGAITSITGYESEDFQKISVDQWTKMIHAEDRQGVMEILERAMSEAKDEKVEYRFVQRNGQTITVEDSGSFLTDEAGKAYRMVGTMKDITERKGIEEQLRQAEKMGAIGQLAGGIAHDFNNQLTGVLGYAGMLREQLEDEELKSFAVGIEEAAVRSSGLTAQLLAFSRRGKFLVKAVDVHQVIADVVSILDRSIDKRITVAQDLHTSALVIQGDPTQLQNALLNIALNARDAMPQGGELTITTEKVQLDSAFLIHYRYEIVPGNYAAISITDTGSGMDRETQQHIFEPFFTTKEVGKGTGMGLASVYGTINNHQGAITVYSEVGRGTVIKVYLPLGEGIEPGPIETITESPITGNARVLLVDDEPVVRKMGQKMLTDLGYSVTTCADGKEAVEFYQKSWQEIDLVILDMVMPVMGGLDTFVAMSQINPDCRVILSSGYSINGEAQGIMDRGVKDFVGKPYDRATLSGVVARVLGNEN